MAGLEIICSISDKSNIICLFLDNQRFVHTICVKQKFKMLKWSCDGCEKYAEDSHCLVYQWDKLERVVLKDSNNMSFIECVYCKKWGHLKCITNVKEDKILKAKTAYTSCHSKIYHAAMQTINKSHGLNI